MARRRKVVEEVVEAPVEEVAETEEVVEEVIEKVNSRAKEASKPMSLKSLSNHVLDFGGISIPAKGELTLTDNDMKNDRAMRKIKHAIKLELIKEV